ncbi:histidine kinase dimerization/phospho-acceptor domain-containing protein [Paenibacillus polymyxa]|uniref:histidine kinase dimerization/phospho-acceptor domain-containing protein n=1 Tax=Paenibacillus polymyxa TaxID=1406 RepID=UPI00288A0627|nr:histidine kinase dimerization/phospho-acceptor domain-containing protein [Paenibacillus polymyxa]
MKLLQTKRMDRYKYLIIMLIIFGVLIGMRSVWSELFHTVDEHRAVNGVLDLRDVDLDQSPTELHKGDKINDQFLANTSHELRTPLHGIINIAHNVITRDENRFEGAPHCVMPGASFHTVGCARCSASICHSQMKPPIRLSRSYLSSGDRPRR